MSPSKSGSCRRTTKVQPPSEQGEDGGGGGPGGGGGGEKNIRQAAAAQRNIKPGSFVLFNKEGSGGMKKYRKQHFLNLPF